MVKRAVIGWMQTQGLVRSSIDGNFYKVFIVMSKDAAVQIAQKIANSPKKDTIAYMQDEFAKSRKWFTERLHQKV